MKRCVLFACLVFVLAAGVAPGLAQQSSGEIFGKVADTSGAVLPGATVTIESPAMLQPQTAVTTDTGAYRFPSLPIGTYTVRFELAGFKKVVRTGIIITAGFNANISQQLEISQLEETITVSGEAPVVDTKATTIGTNFTNDLLQKVPSARDPWVILEQTPGMVLDRQNVGGSQSGQQSTFLAHGSSSNQMWNMDGATITDMSAGGSPAYYDFDAFEEIQVQTGGADASVEAGGVMINMISKTGTNKVRGSLRVIGTNESLQGSNVTERLRAMNVSFGNPLKTILDYGFEAGGPIVKDKLWFWGGYSRNDITVGVNGFFRPGCTDRYNRDCLQDDKTELTTYNAKPTVQWTRRHKSSLYWSKNEKYRNARGAGIYNPIETTNQQKSPGLGSWILQHQYVATDRLMFETKLSFVDNQFVLDYNSPGLKDVQATYDIDTTMNGRSGSYNSNVRRTYEGRLDGNYFLSGFIKGDHALKFGYRYREAPIEEYYQNGGGATARFNRGVPYQVSVTRDGEYNYKSWEHSLYVQDSWKMNRLTLNLGVRYDRLDDEAYATSIPANQLLPDLLPALTGFKGADTGIVWDNFSPRLGLTYDVFGNGKTVVKANSARYWGMYIVGATTLSPTGQTTLRYWWNDLNGDATVQRNEIDFARGFATTPTSNYDPANPTSVVTKRRVDPNLKDDVTDEFIVGVDHELVKDFAVGVSYIHRKYHGFNASYYLGVNSSDYAPVTFTARCGNGTCDQPTYTGVYYQKPNPNPLPDTILRNNDQARTYQGVEFTARKRLTNKWMVFGAFTWNDTRYNYGKPVVNGTTGDYVDPTNLDKQEGKQVGTMNVRWVGKASAIYVMPWGFSGSAFFNFRQGYPLNRTILSPNRTGGGGQVSVLLKDNNTDRLPNFYQLDLRLDKTFSIGRFQALAAASVFNALNSNVILGQTATQNSLSANNVTTILAPRVVRFDLRIRF